MLDTLDLKLTPNIYTPKQKNRLIERLENIQRKSDENGELLCISGNIRNYGVSIYPDKIFLNGSLSKFVHGTNLLSLQKCDILPAIKELKTATGLPVHLAQIIRIDFALNIFVEQLYKLYIPYFEETYGYIKGTSAYSGLTYKKNKEINDAELHVYNKLPDLKKHDPELYAMIKMDMRNNNLKGILRIEHRQKTNVRKMLLPNSQRIMMVHLLYKKVQQNLIQLWLKNYYAINKNKTPRFPTNVKDFKEMKNILACKQIHIEGINKILADADEAATVNNWTPKKKSVTKKEIRNLYNTQFESTSPHYIMEIEEKVRTNVELLQWISDWDLDVSNLMPPFDF